MRGAPQDEDPRHARARVRRPAVGALVDAGMDGVRLNFSHGTHEDHAARAQLVRDVQAEVGRPLALVADLQGPKLRVGELDAPRRSSDGDEIVVARRGVGAATATCRSAPR